MPRRGAQTPLRRVDGRARADGIHVGALSEGRGRQIGRARSGTFIPDAFGEREGGARLLGCGIVIASE